jgi:hypothetical protein
VVSALRAIKGLPLRSIKGLPLRSMLSAAGRAVPADRGARDDSVCPKL